VLSAIPSLLINLPAFPLPLAWSGYFFPSFNALISGALADLPESSLVLTGQLAITGFSEPGPSSHGLTTVTHSVPSSLFYH
jgi:hypothetical protein